MKDLTDRLQQLLTDAEDCDLIGKLATDMTKRETFKRLADQLRKAAADIEQVIAQKKAAGET
jgi:hypothetical protein